MTIFTSSDLSLDFAGRIIFEKVNLSIYKGDKIGIVGRNGVGKTSLLNIILGKLNPSSGHAFLNKQITIGYLAQDSGLDSDKTILEEFLLPFTPLIEIEKEIEIIQETLSIKEGDNIKLSSQLSYLYEEYEREGGYEYRSRIKSILEGLSFYEETWGQKIDSLSGGEKTRLALGRMLVFPQDLLVLDEPTNHLDIKAIGWLEEYLKAYTGSLLTISHDREFLSNVCQKTMLIENQSIYLYNAPYEKYELLRKADLKYQEKLYLAQQKEIERTLAFVENQRKWNRERNIIQAESRLKQLEKMTLVERVKKEFKINRIDIQANTQGGNDVLFVDNLTFSYTDYPLFENISFNLYKGDRFFIKGDNGTGKTSLLRVLTGQLKDYSGSFKFGKDIEYAYYRQGMEDLNEDNTILDEVYYKDKEGDILAIRNSLAAFGFMQDDVYKKISKLSGGEKARVSLLKVIRKGANLLILDEPTNHLDISSQEALEKALKGYQGTLICISHDRFFTRKLETKSITLEKILIEEEKKDKSEARQAYIDEREEKKATIRKKKQIENLEKEIPSLEKKISSLEDKLHSLTDYVKAQEIYFALEKLKEDLHNMTDEYLSLIEEDL